MADGSSSQGSMEQNKEMQCFATRLDTFQIAHQLSKRRASAQTTSTKKKGGANVVEWPHVTPKDEDLARAGFFYRPALDSLDNVQCFHCGVKLDGWEASDDPFKEHLAHSESCNWALAISAGLSAQHAKDAGDDVTAWKQQDPMSTELLAARRGTFEAKGAAWPHESKKGWKCKMGKMIEAGWCYDPAPPSVVEDEEQDGVTCFYCNLSLDGWEPKDDPLQEHTRRSPECAFFALVQMYGSGTSKKGAKGKGNKATARSSTASKASRLSAQSTLSQFSEAPNLADLGTLQTEDAEMQAAGVDDSIVTTASQATATGNTKGKKGKDGRAKAPAKGAKGRKRASTVDSQVEEPVYPDLGSQVQSQAAEEQETVASHPQPAEVVTLSAPAKKTRKGATRGSKAPQIDSSVIEISAMDLDPQTTTKAKRGRKAKAKAEAEPEPEAESAGADDTDVSAQLQEELERSLSIDMDARFEVEDKVSSQPEKPKRGTKRTSDGMKKAQQPQEDSDISATVTEFPVPPQPAAPVAKGKKGRKTSKQINAVSDSHPATSTREEISISDVEAVKPAKGKKATASKAKGKGKKASSARSSRSSKATITESEQPQDEVEDLERDEREIEAELARIAAEQAKIESEQDRAGEFEASPSQSRALGKQNRKVSEKIVEAVAGSPPDNSPVLHKIANPTPSPAGSDKENDPSSASLAKASSQPISSPTKTTRIPLVPGTPNRLLASPSKRILVSPSKQISHLTSTQPWESMRVDAILLASPQPTPGTLAGRLVGVGVGGGGLASPEKGMSVEEWVRFQAQKGEEELRRKCEEMVGTFEREGMRALGCLEGIRVVA